MPKYMVFQVFNSPTGEYFTIDGYNLCSCGEPNMPADTRDEALSQFHECAESLRSECGFGRNTQFALIETLTNQYDGKVVEVG